MPTEYLNPTTTEVRRWMDLGSCPWCGGNCPGDQCYARKCDSCSSVWKSDALADVSDGYKLAEEYCPDCQVWLNSYHATVDGVRTLCGSKIEPDIKLGEIVVTCAECLPVWDTLHLQNPAYAAPEVTA